MYLTKEEEMMLEGEDGPAVEILLELLVTLGKIFGAERLVPVESAHISGVSYKNLGKAGLEWLEEQAGMGAKTRIRATLNPAGMDMEAWREMGVPEEFAENQRRVIDAFVGMGVEPTCTCTPYLVGHIPKYGSQVAWAESSAICYVNSVIGARTNRESGPTSLASAVTGRSALYGYRLDENRIPDTLVKVKASLTDVMDYSALGYVTGKRLGMKVPYFRGLGIPSMESKRALGAACATSGGIALWHGEGLTPEAKQMQKHLDGLESVDISQTDLDEEVERLTTPLEKPIIMLGCPQTSLGELSEISNYLKDQEFEQRLWVFTSRGVFAKAKEMGYIQSIYNAGGRVYKDTCMVVAPLKEMGLEEVATNSFKAGHYMASMGLKTRIGSIRELLAEDKK